MTDNSQTKTPAQAAPEPIGWLHTLHMELGQIQRRFTFSEPHPFGLPGEHYSPEYWVTSEPLFSGSPPAAPTHTLLAAARALVHEIAESGTHERWKRLANALETEEERAAQPPAAPVETGIPLQAIVQQAIMAHPHFEGSATLAFGLAGAALKALSRSSAATGGEK